MTKVRVATPSEIDPAKPAHALVANVDLVIVRWPEGDDVTVLYGRCLHRGALLSDGEVRGEDLICGVHGWDYRFRRVCRHTPTTNRHLSRFAIDDLTTWKREMHHLTGIAYGGVSP